MPAQCRVDTAKSVMKILVARPFSLAERVRKVQIGMDLGEVAQRAVEVGCFPLEVLNRPTDVAQVHAHAGVISKVMGTF